MSGAAGESRPVVCCDLDGVVWRGEVPINGAAAGIGQLREAGLRVVFLTNNSSGRVRDNLERLAAAGVDAAPDDVVSSAQAAAALLAGKGASGVEARRARVLVCAGPGVVEALHAYGFETVDAVPADAVVVGWHRDFDFERLRRAADGVRSGARFIATNLDPTYPGTEAGKPEPAMAALVRLRYDNPVVMIGDRPSTDGAFATALGVPFALVLSGGAGTAGEEAVPDPAPAFVARDLGELAPMLVGAFGRASQ